MSVEISRIAKMTNPQTLGELVEFVTMCQEQDIPEAAPVKIQYFAGRQPDPATTIVEVTW